MSAGMLHETAAMSAPIMIALSAELLASVCRRTLSGECMPAHTHTHTHTHIHTHIHIHIHIHTLACGNV